MRFFHLGDLHFGKLVHSVPMVQKDQPFWVERFLEKVDEYKPDAVLIAGDVYDKRIPSAEAVQLCNEFLTQLAKRGVPVLMIAGNHDSGVRLSFGGDILKKSNIHIVGEVTREIRKVTVTDEFGPVHFYLMPYLYPRIVADPRVLNDPEITGYDQAVRALLAAQDMDQGARNVILAHQNVLYNGTKPEHSESETVVGGLGEIDASAFDAFDYVALGHIHNAQAMGRQTVRYAGCPLYYDFSEENRKKDLTLVELGEKGDVRITPVELPLLHRMKRITGTLKEILSEGKSMEHLQDYYIQAVVQDQHLPAGAMDRLRAVFGENLINVERRPQQIAEEISDRVSAEKREEMGLSELFSEFFKEMNEGMLLEGKQEAFLQRILEQQQGSLYCRESRDVPEKDVEELVAFLINSQEGEV
ncbi:MAG: exonuclease SbcCD subunit D [Lachnospiraceae bacterium]|nr:exonuclease SbcCD subunit D [Lachnospiraceae bacterium]